MPDLYTAFHGVYDKILHGRVSHAEGDVAKSRLGGGSNVLHAQSTSCYPKTQERA